MKSKKIERLLYIGAAVLSIALSLLLMPQLMKLENSLHFDETRKTLRIHILEEHDPESYGRCFFVKEIKLNGKPADLPSLSDEQWLWFDEYQYMAFQGTDEDLVIECNDALTSVSIEYICMEAGGRAEFLIGGELYETVDTFKAGEWDSPLWTERFLKLPQIILQRLADALLFFVILALLISSALDIVRKDERVTKSDSLGMFNAARGFAISVVVFGHCVELISPINESTGSVTMLSLLLQFGMYSAMAFFVIISGYGFRPGKQLKTIKNQLRVLVRPYLITAGFLMAVNLIRAALSADYSFADVKFNMLPFAIGFSGEGMVGSIMIGTIGPIWFCVALCFAWILLNLIFLLKNGKLRAGAVVLCILISWFLSKWELKKIMCIGCVFLFVPFLYLGYISRKYKVFKKIRPWSAAAIAGAVYVMLILMTVNGNMFFSALDMGRYFLLGTVLSLAAGWVLLWFYFRLYIDRKVYFKPIEWVGMNTYHIIYIHTFEYLAVPWDKIAHLLPGGDIFKMIAVFILRSIVIWLLLIPVNAVSLQIKRKGVK